MLITSRTQIPRLLGQMRACWDTVWIKLFSYRNLSYHLWRLDDNFRLRFNWVVVFSPNKWYLSWVPMREISSVCIFCVISHKNTFILLRWLQLWLERHFVEGRIELLGTEGQEQKRAHPEKQPHLLEVCSSCSELGSFSSSKQASVSICWVN